jgi:hypothetical protein
VDSDPVSQSGIVLADTDPYPFQPNVNYMMLIDNTFHF